MFSKTVAVGIISARLASFYTLSIDEYSGCAGQIMEGMAVEYNEICVLSRFDRTDSIFYPHCARSMDGDSVKRRVLSKSFTHVHCGKGRQ